LIGKTISHYRIVEKLGEGGMGVVYIAEDTVLGRRVAIKSLPAEHADQHFRMRFLREAQAVSRLSHPHIATIHDYGETEDGEPYIVMELVKGQTLSALMREEALTIPRVIEIVKQVAEALAEAHHNGIVHRDIKPSNIAINERGDVKVLDFGLAKQIDIGPSDPDAHTRLNTQTREGVILGTPMYLSPEQALGVEVDERSDLFSLGSVLYECIAGRPAFSGKSPMEICAQVVRDDPPPPSKLNPGVSSDLDRIALKALAKKPEARYQSADEMIAALESIQAKLQTPGSDRTVTRLMSLAPGTHPTGALGTLSDIFKRPRLSIGYVAAGLIVVGLIAFGAWRLTRAKPHQPTAEAQRLYTLGVSALRDGASFKASKLLAEAVKEDDNFPLAHARMAEAWTELDYTDKAKDELIRAGDLVPERSSLTPLDGLRFQAISDTIKRDFAKAIESYGSIASQVSESEKASASLDLGRAYEKNEDLDKTIESYVDATKRDSHHAGAFLRLGITYGRRQDLAKAEAAFAEASRLYQLSTDTEGVAEVLFQRGSLLNNIDKLPEALNQLQQALEMAKATGDKPQQIKTLLQLASVSYSQRDTTGAQQYADKAVELARSERLDNLITSGIIEIGNIFFLRGEFDAAEKYFNEALQIAQASKGRRGEARALLSLGSLRVQQVKPDEGITYVKQALDFYQQGGYRKETSQALLLIGRANSLKGDYDQARQVFERQLQLAEQQGDQSEIASSHTRIGNLLARQEKYSEALGHLDQSYSIQKPMNAQSNLGYVLMNRGNVLWPMGRYEEARSALAQAAAIASGSSEKYSHLLAWIHLIRAQMALSQLQFLPAETESRQALVLAKGKYPDVVAQALLAGGLARVRSGAKQEGRGLCEDGVETAKQSGDPWLVSKALLLHARVLLETGDPQGALTDAIQAQQNFGRSGQQDSEWQAWFVASRASRMAGDLSKSGEYASKANDVLRNLQEKLDKDAFSTYANRPDIQDSRRQLSGS